MWAFPLAVLLAAVGIAVWLAYMASRRVRAQRKWQESLADQDPLPRLRFDGLPSQPQAVPYVEPWPVPNRNESGRSNVRLHVPPMRDSAMATGPQISLLSEWLGEQVKGLPLSKRQASLLLDICHYLNGLWMIVTGDLPNEAIRVVFVSIILEDATLWRAIRSWGRGRYSSGRSSHVPELNQGSPLFKRMSALASNVMDNPAAWLARQLGP